MKPLFAGPKKRMHVVELKVDLLYFLKELERLSWDSLSMKISTGKTSNNKHIFIRFSTPSELLLFGVNILQLPHHTYMVCPVFYHNYEDEIKSDAITACLLEIAEHVVSFMSESPVLFIKVIWNPGSRRIATLESLGWGWSGLSTDNHERLYIKRIG